MADARVDPALTRLASDPGVESLTRRAALGELALEEAMRPGSLERAVGLARESLDGGEVLGAESTLASAYAEISALMWCGVYAEAIGWLDHPVERSRAQRELAAESTARYCRARARLASGDVA